MRRGVHGDTHTLCGKAARWSDSLSSARDGRFRVPSGGVAFREESNGNPSSTMSHSGWAEWRREEHACQDDCVRASRNRTVHQPRHDRRRPWRSLRVAWIRRRLLQTRSAGEKLWNCRIRVVCAKSRCRRISRRKETNSRWMPCQRIDHLSLIRARRHAGH